MWAGFEEMVIKEGERGKKGGGMGEKRKERERERGKKAEKKTNSPALFIAL